MPIKYTNRRSKTYYLHQGKTRVGKPMYFFSLDAEGALVNEIPEGYEIYENPHGQVFLRKRVSRLVTDQEIATVENGMRKFSRGDLYKISATKNIVTAHTNGQPMMRFILVDIENRKFVAQRYCFRGAIDDWIDISGRDSLENLTGKYLKHLGQDSFYELFGF